MTRGARWLLAFLAGALWAFCFGREPLLVAPWLVLAPLLLLLSGPGRGLAGWFHGLGFWLVGISWIPATLETFGYLPWWLAAAAQLLLTSYLALFHAAFAYVGGIFWRRGGASVLATLPSLWVALELLRSHLLTGFPWNLTGYSTAAMPGALDAAGWIGSYGLSALVVLVNASVALAISRRSWAPAAWVCLLVLTLFALAGRVAETREESGPAGSVTLLQPNIANLTEWDPSLAEGNYRRVFDQSRDLCRPGELLIWPESASWPYSYESGSKLERDVAELVEAGCTLLFNSPFREGDRYYNAVLLKSSAAASGSGARYDKQHLVPFGEYVPLGGWLPFLKRIARAAGDFSPGPRGGNLDWRGESLGASICFEVTFPGEVAAKVSRGASMLVTVTNDAWYGDTWAPWQHLQAARFRAAENRRPLLRAAITGVSAVIGPRGELIDILGVNEEGALRASVAGSDTDSPYTRAPWAVPAAALAVVGFAILLLLKEARRR